MRRHCWRRSALENEFHGGLSRWYAMHTAVSYPTLGCGRCCKQGVRCVCFVHEMASEGGFSQLGYLYGMSDNLQSGCGLCSL
jgi:hypothetical protein